MTGFSPSNPVFPERFRVTQAVPGSEPIDITRQITAATWVSAIPGGFENATLTFPKILTQKERGLLGIVTIEHDGRVLFEGRAEDANIRGTKDAISTDIQCFGLQRLLTDCSTRRCWSMRNSLAPNAAATAKGSSSGGVLVLNTNAIRYVFGRFDPLAPTKYGFRITPSVAIAVNECGQVAINLPTGITGTRLMFNYDIAGVAAWSINVHSSSDGVNYTRHLESATNGNNFPVSINLVNGCNEIRIAAVAVGAGSGADPTGSTAFLNVYNLRVLGTNLNEDSAGGFYGGTILRDVVAQCPGLYPGTVEDGSDFVLAEINRVNRTTCLDVVQQIAPLYAREWAVWEAGRFDWITPDLKAPGWIVPLDQASGWEIQQSLDTLHRRTYVTFQDAADQIFKETFVDSGIARNPYVRIGAQKDGITPAPAPMTSISAPLLAAKVNNDLGRWPTIKGSLTLPAASLVEAANGVRQIPAFTIRAGDNVTIPDLPVEDIYASGQDGQTTFHVTGVQTGTTGETQLTLEGLTRRIDVLMARLGAVS